MQVRSGSKSLSVIPTFRTARPNTAHPVTGPTTSAHMQPSGTTSRGVTPACGSAGSAAMEVDTHTIATKPEDDTREKWDASWTDETGVKG
jgi:hypothetical protein